MDCLLIVGCPYGKRINRLQIDACCSSEKGFSGETLTALVIKGCARVLATCPRERRLAKTLCVLRALLDGPVGREAAIGVGNVWQRLVRGDLMCVMLGEVPGCASSVGSLRGGRRVISCF